MSTVVLYELIDPRTHAVRYVGISSRPKRRYALHCAPSSLSVMTHKTAWIKSLRDAGLKPMMRVLCYVATIEEAAALEVAWIQKLQQRGVDLTNGTAGGDLKAPGLSMKGRRHSPETIERMKEAAVGRAAVSPETRAKMRAAHLGKQLSPEHAAALAKAMTGHTVSETTRQKIGAKHKGKTTLDETRKQISVSVVRTWANKTDEERADWRAKSAAGRKPLTEEGRQKIVATHTGRVVTAETRAKLRKARYRTLLKKAEEQIAALQAELGDE